MADLTRLDVGDRFLTLQQLVDDAASPTPETLAAYAYAAMAVVRHLQGRVEATSTIFAIERARTALLDARLPNAEPRAPEVTDLASADGREGEGCGGPSGRRPQEEVPEEPLASGSASPPNPRVRREARHA